MENDLLKSIRQRIELSWSDTGAWPEYIEIARSALFSDRQAGEAANRDSSKWALLPGLCCQAAGGDPHLADDLAAAWLMFYLAADLMDSVEDKDEPDAWWAELGSAAAINVATGLFFGASRSLNRYYHYEEIGDCARELIEDFHTSFIRMCGGQHQDLTIAEPSLEQYWKIAESKSGTFFSLACRSGARLATANINNLESFGRFGNHLGVLIQILDDLEDLNVLSAAVLPKRSSVILHSLPVVYALEVSPTPVRRRLKECLMDAHHDPQASHAAFELIENSGVVLYVMTEIERHKQKARACLEQVNPRIPVGEPLVELICSLGSSE